MDSLNKISQPAITYLTLASMLGKMKPGEQMPAERQMMAQLGAPYRSIDLAYRRLENEGAISRRRGRGTFVIDPFAGGVFLFITSSRYLYSDSGANVHFRYLALERLIRERHPRSRLELLVTWDPDRQSRQREADLCRHVKLLHQHTHLLGVFSGFYVHQASRKLFQELGLPLVDFGSTLPHSVLMPNVNEFCAIGLRHLMAEGWTDVGIVGLQEGTDLAPVVAKLGAECGRKPPVIRTLLTTRENNDWAEFEGTCITLGRQLARERTIPEILFITDDVIGKAVLLGAQLEGVNLPERCGIVILSNAERKLYTSRELTRIEYNATDMAREALRIMEALFRGETEIARTMVSPQLIVAQSSRKSDYLTK